MYLDLVRLTNQPIQVILINNSLLAGYLLEADMNKISIKTYNLKTYTYTGICSLEYKNILYYRIDDPEFEKKLLECSINLEVDSMKIDKKFNSSRYPL